MNTRRILPILTLGLLSFNLLFVPPVEGQQQPAPDPATPAPAPEPAQVRAPVTLDGQVLFLVGPFRKYYPAEMRAERISVALKNVAEDYTIAPNALTVVEDVVSTDVLAGDYILFSILDDDASAEGISRQALGQRLLQIVGSAIEKYRRDRAPQSLLLSTLYALLATAAFIAFMLLFFRANRRLMAWLPTRFEHFQVRTRELVKADWALHVVTGVWGPVRLIIVAGLVIGYLGLVLGLFPWTRPFAFRILDFILVPLRIMANSIVPEIPSLFFILVLVVVTRYIIKFIRFLFAEIECGKIVIAGFFPDWSQPTFNIVRVLVIAFAVVVAFPYIPGSDSLAFQGISVFLGVLLSLGSTSAVSNMVAGILLTYMRSFKVGDVVTIGNSSGVVTAVSMLVTHVSTFKKEQITIPNAIVLSAHVTNYSKADVDGGLILHTSVSIGYGTPWRQVEALLLMAAERTPGILREPAPFVLQTRLDDFYVSYQLNASTSNPKKMWRTYSELHANIQDAFNEYGVQIMSPHYEADRNAPTWVPKDQWFSLPAIAPRRTEKREDETMRT